MEATSNYLDLMQTYQEFVDRITICKEIDELHALHAEVVNRPYLIHLFRLKEEEILRKGQISLTF